MLLIQLDIAEHLDMSQAAVSTLMAELGIDWKTTELDQIRVAYIRRLREQAAGRAAAGDLDLATERAMLAREQRVRIEMQNAVTRGELAPVILIEEVLTKAASKVAGVLDAIPGMIRRRVPLLTAGDIELIAGEIAKARNSVAAMSLADLDEAPEDTDAPELTEETPV
jgi:phage terminase Nu1 subunit (DNA packaging protein)